MRTCSPCSRSCAAVLLLLVTIATSGCAPTPGPDVIVIGETEMLLGVGGEAPPPADAPGWRAQPLPDLWTLSRRREVTEAWYRATITLRAAPAELWAVYIARPGFNVAVFVDGTLVGDGGRMTPPISRNWNRPLLFPVPGGLLHTGANVVDVHLAVDEGSPAVLGQIRVGPDRSLRPLWEWRYLHQITLAQVMMSVTLFMAVVLGIVYLPRDTTGAHRWIVSGILLWGWSTAMFFVRDPPAPAWWTWSESVAVNAFVPCLVVGYHRALGIRRPVLERTLLLLTVTGAVLLAAVPRLYGFAVFLVWLVVTVAVGVYLVGLATTVPGRLARARWMAIPAVLGLVVGVHDVGQFLLRSPDALLFWPYVLPLAMLLTGAATLAHLADGLDESERLNRELEHRVEEKHAELERNYRRVGELERATAVAAERDRIMRDMHDGMGGQLVSTLAMVESGRASSDAIADALGAALDDLRIVIDSLDPAEEDVVAALASIRARMEPRLVRHGLRFDWRVTDVPRMAGFGPERVLQVLRIVQEAVTNVLKHAGATTITITTATAPDVDGRAGVVIEVRDDGCGFDRRHRQGRGLPNMTRRADALGGTVTIDGGPTGTAVRLWLPLATPLRS